MHFQSGSMQEVAPFETIESALEYMTLLEQVVADTSSDLQGKLAASADSRVEGGLHLAIYKLDQLFEHVQKSRRILNDLMMIRRVLSCDESE